MPLTPDANLGGISAVVGAGLEGRTRPILQPGHCSCHGHEQYHHWKRLLVSFEPFHYKALKVAHGRTAAQVIDAPN